MKIEHPSRLLAILDDDKSVQSALRDLVEAEGMSALCFSSAEQFLHSSDRHKVGCLIADIHMPGMSGIELQAKLRDERCGMPIIFLTGRGDIPSSVSAMKCGAIDFFTKPVEGAMLLNSVEKALQWDSMNRQETIEHTKLVARYESLTPREREVLHLLASGLLNKQAAYELGITEYTVQFHRGHIMRKMEADSFATLVRLADKVRPQTQITKGRKSRFIPRAKQRQMVHGRPFSTTTHTPSQEEWPSPSGGAFFMDTTPRSTALS